MNTRMIALTILAALVLAACGTSDASQTAETTPDEAAATADTVVAGASTEAAPPPQTTSPPPAASSPAAWAGETALGATLVGENGLTLYGFTNDTQASSTCGGTCAEAWPPVIVGPDWDVAPDLDAGIFATTTRDDGQLQLVAGQWPLYYFAGDAAPGDINGQSSGGVWFAASVDGSLLTDAAQPSTDDASDNSAASTAAAVVSTATSDLGDVLVDPDGLTLYGFTNDVDGLPTCEGDCADAWPPLLVDSAELPDGLDSEIFSVVERTDGTFQLSAGVWPLYRFAGDSGPGDVNGQGSGDVWFAATPDGGLVREDTAAQATQDAAAGGDGYKASLDS